MKSCPSPNFDERGKNVPIDMLVVHYTGMESGQMALDRLCDEAAKVSAHYLIDEDGTLYQLVDEQKRAWHAGVASWRGATDINARSIGIELVNPGHEFGYREFPESQLMVFRELAKDIIHRHTIPPRNVVGHSDVAPTRKSDPGEFFPWQKIANDGIGVWPEQSDFLDMSSGGVKTALETFGYNCENLTAAIKAFQRRFRPKRVNGRIDGETARLALGLTDLVNGLDQ